MRATAAFFVASSLLLTAGCSKYAGASRPPDAPSGAAPVARVNGQVIIAADLASEARASLAAADAKHAEEVYGVNARALDALIDQKLLAARAAREGLTIEALVQRDIASKVPEPDVAYLKSVYDQTKATGRQVPPFESAKEDIARFVKGESLRTMQQSYVAALRAEANVEILLPPFLVPAVDVKADGPSRGEATAPVTIVEFSDYECPFCGGAEAPLKRLRDEYPGKVRVVFRSFPLSGHPEAPKASEAALCAGEQGHYWEMHDRLFANQQALSTGDLKGHARAVGLDAARFDQCLDSGKMATVVEADRAYGESLGVNSTPTFFIDGHRLTGNQSFEKFKEITDHELGSPKR